MSPRPYRTGERRLAATQATRERIIAATRELLSDSAEASFSIDAVAERANVARMTVYYQFKSKGKLLEALFDDFAAEANMRELGKAFEESDPARGVDILVAVFCRLWSSHRVPIRRLNAMAILDPEVGKALRDRVGWRHEALTKLLGKKTNPDTVDMLHVFTGFEVFDALAQGRSNKEVVRVLQQAAGAILETNKHKRR